MCKTRWSYDLAGITIMNKRPDLTHVEPMIRSYIEALEAELEQLRGKQKRTVAQVVPEEDDETEILAEIAEPTEPPTTINLITATASGIAKRTPRHFYNRQRRGGMGIFDMDIPPETPPAVLALADQRQGLILFTNLGRAFRLQTGVFQETPVRGRGELIFKKPALQTDEKLVAILPEQAQGYVALASQTGMVRLLRHHVFGEHMKPGTALYDYRSFGPLASACWTPGDSDLFIATRQGRAIRFSEKLVSPQGSQGIRLSADDLVIGVTSVYSESGVFLLSANGRGTIRVIEGFTANKAPGAGGKIAINSDHLICAITVEQNQDIFIISKLSKIIRFPASDIPLKDGVVQGVICMSLRADEPMAVVVSNNS
jgi:DNA gyrase subunit A